MTALSSRVYLNLIVAATQIEETSATITVPPPTKATTTITTTARETTATISDTDTVPKSPTPSLALESFTLGPLRRQSSSSPDRSPVCDEESVNMISTARLVEGP
ncbi:hypothetical protein FRC17_005243 [Serendipita sp. 399]|nr:hypothetical protein FRC17_005243 [Serendipita sp. 399]